jgi:hypothetical protein
MIAASRVAARGSHSDSTAVLVAPMRRRPARNSRGAAAPARAPSSRSSVVSRRSVTGTSTVAGRVTAVSAPSPAAAVATIRNVAAPSPISPHPSRPSRI